MDDNNISEKETKLPETKKKKLSFKVIIVVLAVVILGALVCGGIYLKNYINEIKADSGIKEEPNVFFDDESAEEYMKDMVSSIGVHMNQRISCAITEDGSRIARVNVQNDNDFQYIVKFVLVEDDKTTDLYTSGLVPPGGKIETIPINEELEPGTYSVNVIFTAISGKDNRTDIGSTGLNTDMEVFYAADRK